MILLIILLGLAAGILAGLMGVGGGVVLVPSLGYLLGMDQHLAQGTTLFILLFPLGLGALYPYWKSRQVDVAAGIVCGLGLLAGGYFGGMVAVKIPSGVLRSLFGVFLMFVSALLWRRSGRRSESGSARV